MKSKPFSQPPATLSLFLDATIITNNQICIDILLDTLLSKW